MIRLLYFISIVLLVSCRVNHTIIWEHVDIKVYTYEHEGKVKASAIPGLRPESTFIAYNRRFEYLLMNVPEIHFPENAGKRKEIWSLYPDTVTLKRLYLREYARDKKLVRYFELTSEAISNKNISPKTTFTENELMEVASKFFYCDRIFPDTTIQSHVCVGLNGISEANWDKDYRLLEAFCYEGIFDDLLKDSSQIDETYSYYKQEACLKYRSGIVSLDTYLQDVRTDLFSSMKNSPVLKRKLLAYFERNKANLAFTIIK